MEQDIGNIAILNMLFAILSTCYHRDNMSNIYLVKVKALFFFWCVGRGLFLGPFGASCRMLGYLTRKRWRFSATFRLNTHKNLSCHLDYIQRRSLVLAFCEQYFCLLSMKERCLFHRVRHFTKATLQNLIINSINCNSLCIPYSIHNVS